MKRPILVVHTTYTSQPIHFFPWRFFQTFQAKRLARNPSVRYVVMGEIGTKRPSKAFMDKHSKKSGLLRPVPGAKNVFTVKEGVSSRRKTGKK